MTDLLRSYVDGEWRDGVRTVARTDPAHPATVVAEMRRADPAVATAAVLAAGRGFASWRVTPAPARGEILPRAADPDGALGGDHRQPTARATSFARRSSATSRPKVARLARRSAARSRSSCPPLRERKRSRSRTTPRSASWRACSHAILARRSRSRANCFGVVKINQETAGLELQLPFGGVKYSSSGSRDQERPRVTCYRVEDDLHGSARLAQRVRSRPIACSSVGRMTSSGT
jgi:acyl-CoA reductase-like NAD-dependent aldehyde dehydrogenase